MKKIILIILIPIINIVLINIYLSHKMTIIYFISQYLPIKPDIIDLCNILPENEFKRSPERSEKLDCIIIHNDAIPQNGSLRLKDVVKYHIVDRQYPTIAYHYYIDCNGVIYHCVADSLVTYHTFDYNEKSIAICLNGNFDIERPTQLQKMALKSLIKWLENIYIIDNVYLHRELNNTTCPGLNFTREDL